MSGGIFGCCNKGRYAWQSVGRGQGVVKYLEVARVALYHKEQFGPTVNRTGVEKEDPTLPHFDSPINTLSYHNMVSLIN